MGIYMKESFTKRFLVTFYLQKSKIAEVTYMIVTKQPEVDLASSLFSLLDQLIADCRYCGLQLAAMALLS